MTIWKWKDDGEPVSLKVVLNERIDLLVFRLGEGGSLDLKYEVGLTVSHSSIFARLFRRPK